MRLRDPRAPKDVPGRPDSAVYIQGDRVEVDGDGTFSHSGIDREWAKAYAERNDASLGMVLVGEGFEDEYADDNGDDVCGFVKDDGEKCQRSPGWGRDADSGPCKDHV